MTDQDALNRIAGIDSLFECASGWGSWMVSAANEREQLVNRLRKNGHQIEHKIPSPHSRRRPRIMTPTEQAARWLADVPRIETWCGNPVIWEADALAAIARHLAPGDELVGAVTDAADDWQECLGHVVTALGSKPDWHGAELQKIDELREAAARISALTATVGALQKERDKCFEGAGAHHVESMKQAKRADQAKAEVSRLGDRLARMRRALTRQGDNMAFVLNHAAVPPQWYDKFTRELAEDRAALTDGGKHG